MDNNADPIYCLIMTTTQTTTTETSCTSGSITVRWDTNGDTDGWYAERSCLDDDGVARVDDSMKIWWPVDLEDYGEDDGEAVEAALREEWPDDTIIVR